MNSPKFLTVSPADLSCVIASKELKMAYDALVKHSKGASVSLGIKFDFCGQTVIVKVEENEDKRERTLVA